jgi:succinate-acetate transporter protein
VPTHDQLRALARRGDASPGPDQPDEVVRVVLRPLGNPLPLGFAGLAGATVTLSGEQLHWVPTALSPQVGLVLLLFAAPAQLVASILAFLARDAPAGAGIGVQAATWLTTGAILLTSPPGSRSPVLGLLLFVAAAGVLISGTAAASGKLVPAAVLLLTAVRFAVTGVYEYAGGTGWETTAGWLGVVLGGLALYAGLAADLADARHRAVLPLLRRGRGRAAVEHGGPGPVGTEPGVREQL